MKVSSNFITSIDCIARGSVTAGARDPARWGRLYAHYIMVQFALLKATAYAPTKTGEMLPR